MKISKLIRNIYDDRKGIYIELKSNVDQLINGIKEPRWHYESRIKLIDSFALKFETGRYSKISELEDFFAATIVVENSSAIERAVALLEEYFTVKYKRPKDPHKTHKDPSEFVFEDLRLYVEFKEDHSRPPKLYDNTVFEVQVKTFLQHAWSIATHDMVYKGSEYNWKSNRIAYQVKALLEHAELSIHSHESMAKNIQIFENSEYASVRQIIEYAISKWDSAQLPADLVRFAKNIYEICDACQIKIETLIEICNTSSYVGTAPRTNMSPYTAIALAIFESDNTKTKMLARKKKKLGIVDDALEGLPLALLLSLQQIIVKPQ